ncbi:MAG: carbon-nitrogen hydrolase family protein [Magnetococcales bacterium]|nr:carbon-nitrogen hydrolase family protein [Magnetococcales bacterium]
MKTPVAIIQMNSGSDRADNLRQAGGLMEQALGLGAGLMALPENFSHMGGSEEEKRAHAEDPEDGPSLSFLREFARRHQVWIVGGSIPIRTLDGEKMTNTCFVVDDRGVVQCRYDKIHLFDVVLPSDRGYRESNLVVGGTQPVVCDTPWGRLGLAICYDVRFPELFNRLVGVGATMIALPSAFTAVTGAAHWELLVRGRAVENFCYMLAPGQSGRHPGGRVTHGHSMLVEPWGTIVAQCPDGPGFVLGTIDKDRVVSCRSQIPSWKGSPCFGKLK